MDRDDAPGHRGADPTVIALLAASQRHEPAVPDPVDTSGVQEQQFIVDAPEDDVLAVAIADDPGAMSVDFEHGQITAAVGQDDPAAVCVGTLDVGRDQFAIELEARRDR